MTAGAAKIVKQGIKRVVPPRAMEWIRAPLGAGYYAGPLTQRGAIFIHIPKSAGVSVVQALGASTHPHATYLDYRRANPRKCERLFKFTFVRNPWDRVLSAYTFISQGGTADVGAKWRRKAEKTRARNLDGVASFEQFVLERLDEALVARVLHFRPQHSFICDKAGRNRMDFTGRVETMEKDFAQVCAVLGISAALPHANRSERGRYQDYYTDEMRDIVASLYRADIEMFGYAFDPR